MRCGRYLFWNKMKQCSLLKTIRHKYAASEQGAKDLVKSCLTCAAMDIVLMLPVGLMFFLVKDLMEGTLKKPAASLK